MIMGLCVGSLMCFVPAMIINENKNGPLFEDDSPRRGRRKPSPRRGLPDDATLYDLARTFLDHQHRLWPEMVVCGKIPPLTDESITNLVVDFKQRFLDTNWEPSQPPFELPSANSFGAAYLRFSSDN